MPSLSNSYSLWSNQDLVQYGDQESLPNISSADQIIYNNSRSYFLKRLEVWDFLLLPAWDRKQNQIHNTSSKKKFENNFFWEKNILRPHNINQKVK